MTEFVVAGFWLVVSAIWVYRDASGRDWSGTTAKPWGWAIAVLLLWLVMFPIYLLARRKHPPLSPSPPS